MVINVLAFWKPVFMGDKGRDESFLMMGKLFVGSWLGSELRIGPGPWPYGGGGGGWGWRPPGLRLLVEGGWGGGAFGGVLGGLGGGAGCLREWPLQLFSWTHIDVNILNMLPFNKNILTLHVPPCNL